MKKILHPFITYIRQTDLWLWGLSLGLSGFSLVLLMGIEQSGHAISLGVSTRTIMVQLLATGLGCACAIILSKFDYHTLTKLWKLHLPLAYGLVALTFLIGTGTSQRLEDKSWLAIPGTSMTIQPAEFLKLSFILSFAYHLYHLRDDINRPQNVLALCAHGAVPVLLIHFQGDDGSALVFAAIFACMIFAAGLSWKYIVPALGALIAAFPVMWFFIMNADQRQRILSLYDPQADVRGILYQQHNAKLAIGSGKVWGKGIFIENHKYVPEMHNDFIFSFIGESLGFIGCLATLIVIIALCIKIISNSRYAEDMQGRLICVGVFAMISFQSIVNIGMCLSLLPVIGITLPFLSYGGSSVLASYLGIGLVLSVYMRTPKRLFSP